MDIDTTVHPLHADCPKPGKFTNPFHYQPHPLCLAAAGEVQSRIAGDSVLRADADRGKMFGVLVVECADGSPGYVAAFSGLLAGRSRHPFFVPPVFDATLPGGRFKMREAEITAVNKRIEYLEKSERYAAALRKKAAAEEEGKAEERAFRQKAAEAKARRDARRLSGVPVTAEENAAMVRESQYMNAELRRIRLHVKAQAATAGAEAEAIEAETAQLKAQRKAMSDSLQRWLFTQYSMLNARGERRDLCAIFGGWPQRVPPSGAGDCCAPKLLQYAYLNNLRPVCMAEFWWGEPPAHEVRHHLHYYPACRGKCLPILTHMLQGLDVDEGNPESEVCRPLEIVYEDEWLAVVDKPAGMKSVPGKGGGTSVAEEMGKRRGGAAAATLVNRLDMDTSGLVLVAYDGETYKNLQAQFAERKVGKRYAALLDGMPDRPSSGIIDLPLSPDPLDRPYQKVDYANGKPAMTKYTVVGSEGGKARVALFPMTGRTHQLRVHCAHAGGLGVPIAGDRLYGHGGGRLMLHAEALAFTHPATGKRMAFERKADF